jgi:hypothetical protein
MGYLLTDAKFFLLARTRIRPEWWTVGRLEQLWGIAARFSEKFNRAPTAAEVGECQETSGLDVAEANKLRSTVKVCLQRRADYGLDMLQTELTDWFRCRIYVQSMKKSENLFNMAAKGGQDSKKLGEAFNVLKQMNRDIEDASFEPAVVETLEISDIEAQVLDAHQAVTFGIPKLNLFLNSAANGEVGLLKGDMTVLLAPTNVGKTTTMVTVAAQNIMAGKDVLLVTHEGRIGDIKLKIWQCMMGDGRETLMKGLTNPQYRADLEFVRGEMAKHLEFMPLNKAGMTVEEVDAIVRRRVERWQTAHNGHGFDLVIDDYAAKLTTQQAKGGQFALRQIHEVVYNYFSQMALEHNCHVLTAIQTNREGSRVNNRQGKAESRFLTMEDVMESWGPMTTATNVISINRPPEAQSRGVTGFLLCKSRSSETGVLFLAESSFGSARSHWHNWKCEEYKISSLNGDRVQSILQDFESVEVPEAGVAAG